MMALLLVHNTPDTIVSRFRTGFRNVEGEQAILYARFALEKISNGDLTDSQFRAAFGLNAVQWNAIKTKMQNWITAHNLIQSIIGE